MGPAIHLGREVNSVYPEGEPSFTTGGRLFFVHVEIDFSVTPEALYDSDIYFVEPQ